MFVMVDGDVIVVIVDGVVHFVFVLSFLAQMCEGDFGEKLGVGGRMWKQAHLENPKKLTVSSSVGAVQTQLQFEVESGCSS